MSVPPSAEQLVCVVCWVEVPQQVPRAVMLAPPSEVMLAPRVAPVDVIDAEVGVVTVGAVGATYTDSVGAKPDPLGPVSHPVRGGVSELKPVLS